jgi:hypothetical protein
MELAFHLAGDVRLQNPPGRTTALAYHHDQKSATHSRCRQTLPNGPEAERKGHRVKLPTYSPLRPFPGELTV